MKATTPHNRNLTKPYLRSITELLVFLAIFFIPFNSYKGFSFLGEFAKESAVLFLLAGSITFFFLILQEKKIAIPIKNPIFQALLLLLLWFIVATLLNLPDIRDYYLKKTTGINRFIKQYIVLFFSAIVFLLLYYNIFRQFSLEKTLFLIRKIFLFSLIVVTIYGVLEVAILVFGLGFLSPLIRLFNYVPFTEVKLDTNLSRISSVTFEPPALANYLITVAGWMFSYILTEKKAWKFLPAIAVITLALFSGSRAGIAIVGLQTVLFFFLLVKNKKTHFLVIKLLIVGGIAITGLLLVKGKVITEYLVEKATSFNINDDTHDISNRSRFGVQEANYNVFLNNPIAGVGYGQQSFEAIQYYPNWAKVGNWEFRYKYLNDRHPNFPPGYNLYARILAEGGIIGMLFFVVFIILIFYATFHLIKQQNVTYILGVILFISFVGFFINWFKSDTFRIFGFWLSFAILMICLEKAKFVFKNSFIK